MERKTENKLKIYKCHQIKCRTHTHTHKETNKCGRKNKKQKRREERGRGRQRKLFKCNHLKCLKNQKEMLRKKTESSEMHFGLFTIYVCVALYDIRRVRVDI